MSIQRVTSTEPLTDAECRSLAPARAKRLPYSIAGRIRYLYEMATGESPIDDGGGTPLNPQGLIGADRSGPPFGDAHMHPLWWVGQTLNQASFYAGGQGPGGGQRGILLDNGAGTIRRVVARFFVRPFARGRLKPYRRAYLRAFGTSDDLVTTSAATIRLYGVDGDSGPYMDATVSTTSTAAFSADIYTLVSPGWNERIIEIEQTSANGIWVGPISLNQIVRRSH
jgi:hypothetical protein